MAKVTESRSRLACYDNRFLAACSLFCKLFFSVFTTLQALEVLYEGSKSCPEQDDEDVYPFENEAGRVLHHLGLGNCRVGLKDRKVDTAY